MATRTRLRYAAYSAPNFAASTPFLRDDLQLGQEQHQRRRRQQHPKPPAKASGITKYVEWRQRQKPPSVTSIDHTAQYSA